jgi:CelD/BcsL family acetyltransferase involved in cellulose biosynthesis
LGIVLHRSVPADAALSEQWNRLVLQMERPEVFYTQQWALAVQRAYGEELVPWILLRQDGEQLTGIASLAIEKATGRATFLANTTADYCDVLSAPAERAPWMHSVFEALRGEGVEEITLPNLPADSATAQVLGATGSKFGYRLFLRNAYLCARVQLGSDRERQDLKKNLQKQKIVRRGLNFLRKRGTLTFVHRRSWHEIEPALQAFHVAHVARFLADGQISNLASRRRRLFLHELARSLSESGWLVLSEMMLDDRPMASNFGFEFEGSWFWYQPTFDRTYEHISPGYCLLSTILAEACDRPEIQVVDLGLGAEGYKERVANGTRRTVQAFLASSRRRVLAVGARYFAGEAAKLSPFVESKIRAALVRWRSVRERVQGEGLAQNAAWVARRSAARFGHGEEVIFYRWRGEEKIHLEWPGARFEPLTWEMLAEAAMRFEQDQDTRNYLLRAASRLRSGQSEGFVLLDKDRVPSHFCWVAPMQGFYMAELKTTLSAPGPQDSLIFDCWTPVSLRGRGYYGTAAAMAAAYLHGSGRQALIFSAATNQSSIRGLAGTGFVPDFRLVGNKMRFSGRVKKLACDSGVAPEELVGSPPRG